jgi:hypothetical protein
LLKQGSLALATAVFLLATGCQRDFRPKLAVYVTGTVTADDGSPAPDSNLLLTRDARLLDLMSFSSRDEDHSFFGGTAAPCTFLDPCNILDSKKSGPGGEIKMQTPHGGGSGVFRRPVELHLVAYTGERYQNRGAITFRRFKPDRNQIRRDLVIWAPAFVFDGSVARWQPAPSEVLGKDSAGYAVVFDDGLSRSPLKSTISPVWRFGLAAPGQALDQRLLEDGAGDAALLVTIGSMTHRSDLIAYQGSAGAPPSRGASCVVRGVEGEPERRSDCSFTDGDFTGGPVPPPCPGKEERCNREVRWASVDLGTERQVGLVVLRGCSRTCRVESSIDAEIWTELKGDLADHGPTGRPVGGKYLTLNASGNQTARYVRVVAAEAKALDDLSELSIW